ncbi:MAG TPA: ABC transporter substrate-binding protein [Xanthobacteraceae bacterium]|nr:ABC transporter substrate-binding protein [Xanthobacteraceae bacterium]
MTRKALLTAVVVLAAGAAPALAQDVLKVAIPQRGAWDSGVAELGQRAGIFKKHGLTLEILFTQGGPESIQAVIGGSIDVATAVGTSAAIGTFAKGAPLRLIGSEMIGAPELYWYVRADSAVRTIADLNGRTIAYSLTGSSSHAAVLALIQQYKLSAKPVSTGSIQATVTQTMTGQVDVGFGAAPFGLDVVEDGRARIVATGNDVAALRTRSVRVNVTNAAALAGRRDAIDRFVQAYRETLDWMYADPAALAVYKDYSGLPDAIVRRVRDLIPKEAMSPDRVAGMDQIVAEAVNLKFIAAPPSGEQMKEFVQIPPPMK